jgi:hypothetical protein
MKFSPSGARVAVALSGMDLVQLFRFDMRTGVVSSPVSIPSDGNQVVPYGVEFSPDNNLLYVSQYVGGNIIQYNLNDPSVASSGIASSSHMGWGALQLGPDGRIYCAHLKQDSYLSVIASPLVRGTACDFRERGINLGSGISTAGLPNLIGLLNAPTNIQIGADKDVCLGDSVLLSAWGGTGSSYHWTPIEGVACPDCQATMALPSKTTTYYVRISAGGCELIDSIRVNVRPAPVLSVSAGGEICRGDSLRLQVSGAGSYQWYPSGSLSCENCAGPFAHPDSTTTYVVVGTNGVGCRGSARVTVTVHQPPAVDAGPDVVICPGEGARLAGSGVGSYQWSPPEDLDCPNCPRPLAHPSRNTIYTLKVTSQYGCVARDTMEVIIAHPTADAGTDVAICSGDSAQLNAAGEGSYLWSPQDGLNCFDCPSPVASPGETTTYHLLVTDRGCSASDSVTVTVYPAVVPDAGEDTTICAGESLQLTATGGDHYQWSPFQGLSCSDCPSPVATPSGTTTYHVVAFDAHGCSGEDSVTVRLVSSAVDAGPARTICPGEGAQLNATGGSGWHWSPSDGLSCTDCSDPIAAPAVTTLYTVAVPGDGRCPASDTVTVTVLRPVELKAEGGGVICAGDSMGLHANGGADVYWSPADGLSCTDCADPVARPLRTTTYHVSSTAPCSSGDSVTVSVIDRDLVRGHIGRDYHATPGTTLAVPVLLDDPVAAADTLLFNLRYHPGLLRVRGAVTGGTSLQGWRAEIVRDTAGDFAMRAVAPPDAGPIGTGPLMLLELQLFLGDTASSELPFTLSFGSRSCGSAATSPGLVGLDSICGLSFRLIESTGISYTLKQNNPNPFNPTTTIEFTLGLEGPTQLEVLDASGKRVGLLVDGVLGPGRYSLVWDGSSQPSGLYYCRLSSGTWSHTTRMFLVK